MRWVKKLRGKVSRDYYEQDKSGKWNKVPEKSGIDNSIIDYSHWKKWKDFEEGSYLRGSFTNKGRVMDTYITYSPSGKQKVIYKRIKGE